MEELRKLPNDTGEKLARFFQKMELNETCKNNKRRHSLLIQRPPENHVYLDDQTMRENRARIEKKEKKTAFDMFGTNIQEQDRNHLTTMKSKGINLSKREFLKLMAVSRFYPGQIHNIPLNDKIPLPKIQTQQEKIQEMMRKIPYNEFLLEQNGRSKSLHQRTRLDIIDMNMSSGRNPMRSHKCNDAESAVPFSNNGYCGDYYLEARETRQQVPVTEAIQQMRERGIFKPRHFQYLS